jgi:5'-3' exonuclease
MDDFEADDALAAAAWRFSDDVERVVILSPDKDMAQCVVGDRVVMFDRRREIVIDEDGVWEKWGVGPESIPDYLGLVGDTADGFPGVPSWGAKSASMLLARYTHIDRIPANASDWDVKVRGAERLAANLGEHREDAALFRHLATLRLDVPITESLDDLEWKGVPREAYLEFCDELGFTEVKNRPHKWVD